MHIKVFGFHLVSLHFQDFFSFLRFWNYHTFFSVAVHQSFFSSVSLVCVCVCDRINQMNLFFSSFRLKFKAFNFTVFIFVFRLFHFTTNDAGHTHTHIHKLRVSWWNKKKYKRIKLIHSFHLYIFTEFFTYI